MKMMALKWSDSDEFREASFKAKMHVDYINYNILYILQNQIN